MRLFLVLPLVLLPSCFDCGDAPVIYEEGFEECPSNLCGFTVEDTGTAAIEATIHEGEHGLRMSGNVIVSVAIGHRFSDPGEYGGIGTVSFMTDCPDSLWAVAELVDAAGNAGGVGIPRDLGAADGEWTEVTIPISYPGALGLITLERVSFRNYPNRDCAVDHLVVKENPPSCW